MSKKQTNQQEKVGKVEKKSLVEKLLERTSSVPVMSKTVKVQKPIYSQVTAILTKNVNGQRVAIKTLKVKTMRGFFNFSGNTYQIDLSKAFLFSRKGAYLMYDMDITEPLDKSPGENKIEPIQLGDNVHYSKAVNMIQQQSIIQQALRAGSGSNPIGLFTIAMLIVGAVMGFFAGQTFPINKITTTTTVFRTVTTAITTITTTASSTSTTASMIAMALLGMFI